MKKFEILFGILAAISIAYRFLFSTDLNILLVFSILGLSIFYTYLSFIYFNNISIKNTFKKEGYNEVSKLKLFGTITLGIGLGLACLGILWSLLDWPFNTFYPIAIPVLFIVGIITAWKYRSTKSADYLKMLKRIFIIGGFAALLWSLPDSDLREILEINHLQTVEN